MILRNVFLRFPFNARKQGKSSLSRKVIVGPRVCTLTKTNDKLFKLALIDIRESA